MYKWLIISILSLFSIDAFSQNKLTAYGKVQDTDGLAIPFAHVFVVNTSSGTVCDSLGNYKLQLTVNQNYTLRFSAISYRTVEHVLRFRESVFSYEINPHLSIFAKEIRQVKIQSTAERFSTLNRIDPRVLKVIPNVSGGIEGILKTQIGVSSNNELSSQYAVRGGNFDENLVYVNGIEVYRPFLVRNGQQEGLSFVNSDMVESLLFSAGGFDAKYGDKMSSVLDIRYKKPKKLAGSVALSLLGGSAHLEGTAFSKKMTHISAVRYKTSKYLLNSLDEQGEYNPEFLDFQTYMTFSLSEKSEIAFLGNYSQNSYTFVPEDRNTTFGTTNTALNFYIDFEGREEDQYGNKFGALLYTYKASNNLNIKLIASAYQTNEAETYDIFARYGLSQLDVISILNGVDGEETKINLGIGKYLEHARNYFNANILNLSYKTEWSLKNHYFQFGAKWQQEKVWHTINEWMLLDSAGYSIPYSAESVRLSSNLKARNQMDSWRITGYVQDSYSFLSPAGEWHITGGVRFNYWNFNREFLISPRANFSLKPEWEKDILLRFSLGYFYQSPFYRELLDFDGNINQNVKAQRSLHFVLGSDYNFKMWDRYFKIVAELYYKKLDNLIPYELDNMRISYYTHELATGYVAGFDFKINGEFVPGVESWASFSIMNTKEDIAGDEYGKLPRPSDRLLNVGLFFQDYLPRNKSWKMHLSLLYSSGLPFGIAQSKSQKADLRLPDYTRVDIGFSKELIGEKSKLRDKKFFKHFKSIWLSAEVFNLLGVNNTISYSWVTVVPNLAAPNPLSYAQYAVPNRLTSRRLNLKLIVKF